MTQTTRQTIPIEATAVFPPPGMAIPNTISFSADGSLIYYLSSTTDNPIQQLYAFDIQTGQQRVIVAPPNGGTTEDKLSPEEELRRQRERMLAIGITHYYRAKDSDRLLIPILGDIFVQDGPAAPLRKVVDNAGKSPALNPTFSCDAEWIAYVQDEEIYVVSAAGGEPRQVTTGARGTGKTNGLAEYIAQEEMHRSEGFWWSPESGLIAYTEVDETHIPVYRIMHDGKDFTGEGAQEDHRYPFAGMPNAYVRLAVIPREGGTPVWMDLDFGEEIYLARVFWWKEGVLGAQVLNRPQNTLWLVRFDAATGQRETVLTETNDIWVNLRKHDFTLLESGAFIWTSERSGYNHLYLYAPDGTLAHELTRGEWTVDSVDNVDETNRVVYFSGNREDPTELALYAVGFDGEEIRRITAEAGTHGVVVDAKHGQFVDIHHATNKPPTITLRSASDGSVQHTLPTKPDPRIEQFDLTPPQIVTLRNRNGDTLYGAVYRPPEDIYGAGPYPTIVNVYGGPGPQYVANSWAMTNTLLVQYLRQAGFLVFRLDNRGSARRGLAFEGALKNRMGSVEVEDQVDGVNWLIQQGLADPARVGIYGWSYGGYMTLMCLTKAADTFKVGVAGAPVTHWDGYDTCYTERYMGTPQSNPEGYRDGSVMAHVDKLAGKLLIVHGMLDENVHYRHTARLINALIRARKPFDLLPFPDERHMPRHPQDRIYMNEQIVGYFQKHL